LVATLVLVVLTTGGWLGGDLAPSEPADGGTEGAASAHDGVPVPGDEAAGADSGIPPVDAVTAGPAPTPPLAELAGLEIWLPTASPVIVGFHEAATVSAIGVEPVGTLAEDRNTTRTELPPDVADGTPYLVLTSRGRSAGPTSAIDVVMTPGDPVLSPVTGTVVDVRSYLLYGAHQDLRIEVVPDGRPDVRLVMIHVDGAAVAIGDRVVGGVTPVARSARLFPFGSHIDRETEPERFPHVHIELQPIDAPRLGDGEDGEGEGEGEVDEVDVTGGGDDPPGGDRLGGDRLGEGDGPGRR
jgi:hypothetical protein